MLIVYAHFNREGHCGEILKEVEKQLQGKKQSYEILDLYQLGFDPVLKESEMIERGQLAEDAMVRSFQEKISSQQELIFVYPTWWSNAPAILKGFYDRTFSAGFAFRYQDNGMPEGLLKGKRALVFTTAGGPKFYQQLMRGSRSLKITTADTLEFCGIKTKGIIFGSCTKLDEKKKTEISVAVAKALIFLK